jgi:hypothetical protein
MNIRFKENIISKSNSTSACYNKFLDEEKSKHARFLLGKMVLAQNFCAGWLAGWLKEQYNLTPVVDWLCGDSIHPKWVGCC